MISLNTYSFGYLMGLVKKDSKYVWNFDKFINFITKHNINCIEFPIDYFRRKEKKKLVYFLEKLKKRRISFVIDVEKLDLKLFKELSLLSKNYNIEIVRIKMSNFFGGNRHLVKNFGKVKLNFINNIKKILKIIKYTNIKLAIENHQDLSSSEIIEVIKKTSTKKVGLNWDMGNSFATGETLDDFFKKSKNYLFNVHGKDYDIVRSNQGFYLKRCVLGNGVVNFKKYIGFFKRRKINFSVELGAHYSRHCMFLDNRFLKAHKITKKRFKKFYNYIYNNAVSKTPFTNWELDFNEKICFQNEIKDVRKSIFYIKKLFKHA